MNSSSSLSCTRAIARLRTMVAFAALVFPGVFLCACDILLHGRPSIFFLAISAVLFLAGFAVSFHLFREHSYYKKSKEPRLFRALGKPSDLISVVCLVSMLINGMMSIACVLQIWAWSAS